MTSLSTQKINDQVVETSNLLNEPSMLEANYAESEIELDLKLL